MSTNTPSPEFARSNDSYEKWLRYVIPISLLIVTIALAGLPFTFAPAAWKLTWILAAPLGGFGLYLVFLTINQFAKGNPIVITPTKGHDYETRGNYYDRQD